MDKYRVTRTTNLITLFGSKKKIKFVCFYFDHALLITLSVIVPGFDIFQKSSEKEDIYLYYMKVCNQKSYLLCFLDYTELIQVPLCKV